MFILVFPLFVVKAAIAAAATAIITEISTIIHIDYVFGTSMRFYCGTARSYINAARAAET